MIEQGKARHSISFKGRVYNGAMTPIWCLHGGMFSRTKGFEADLIS